MPVPKHRVFNKFPDDPTLSHTARECLDSMLAQINTLLGQGQAPSSVGGSALNPETLQSPTIITPHGNCTYLLNGQGPKPAITGNGAAQNIFLFFIPGGTLTVGNVVHIYALASHAQAGSVTYTLFWGASGGQVGINTVSTALTGAIQFESRLIVTNSTTQVSANLNSSTTVAQTSSVQAPISGNIQVNLAFSAAASESIVPQFWTVILEQ